jgi:uncharacterized membrane protein
MTEQNDNFTPQEPVTPPPAPGAQAQQPPQYGQVPPQYQQQTQYGQVPPQPNAGAVPPFIPDPADVAANKTIAVLSWLPILFWLPLAAAPNSPFARYCGNQGLLLLLLGVASTIISVIPVLGWLINFAAGIFTLVCWIKGMIDASKGICFRVPLIGHITLLK